jgi:hypothetical protein
MRIRLSALVAIIALAAVLGVSNSATPTSAVTGPSGFVAQTPVRVLNTRSGPMPLAGAELVVNTGRPGASAVVANVTSITPTTPGQFVTAWPSGPRPDTSILNSDVGEVVANSIVVPVAPDGTFRLYTFASAHLLVDISGYFDGGTALPPSGLSATITGYVPVPSLSKTRVLGTVGNGTSEDFRLVRVEVTCPAGELATDQVFLDAFATRGFEVDCPGLLNTGAVVRGVVDL